MYAASPRPASITPRKIKKICIDFQLYGARCQEKSGQHPAATPTATAARPRVDFAFLRGQITMEQVLRHLGQFDRLRGAANSDDASVPCTPNPMIASRPCRSTSARICFTAFTRNAPPRATSWICGLPCTTYRFTKPRCIWPKPSTCSPTEKRHPHRHPLEKRTMARTQFTVPSSPSTDLTFNGTSFLFFFLLQNDPRPLYGMDAVPMATPTTLTRKNADPYRKRP